MIQRAQPFLHLKCGNFELTLGRSFAALVVVLVLVITDHPKSEVTQWLRAVCYPALRGGPPGNVLKVAPSGVTEAVSRRRIARRGEVVVLHP
jgi:hypothetical protein